MYKLSMDKRVAVITALVEGCSIRSTSRMTGVAKGTILRLLEEVGQACTDYQNVTIRNIKANRVQVDEIWSFVGCKDKNVTIAKIERDGICGDVWTFTAIDAQTKLVLGQFETAGRVDFGSTLERSSTISSTPHT